MKKIDLNNRQEVIDAGYKALTESLGPVGFAKFMQYINPGKGDYTKEKYETSDNFNPSDTDCQIFFLQNF